MLASILKHRIDVYKVVINVDPDYNTEPEQDELLYQNLKVSIKYGAFDEGEEFNRLKNSQKITFKSRYRKDINEDCTIHFNNNIYNIIGIEVIGRNEGLNMVCVKK